MTDFPSDPETETFKDGDPLVTALVWEVDRAVKQAMREGGKYDTTIRHILNEHLRGLAQCSQQPVGWRIPPSETLFLMGSTITDDADVADLWRKAGCVVEPLIVLSDSSPDRGSE